MSTHTHIQTMHSPGVAELKHLPLPASVREEIKEKFLQGVTLERIMDGMHIIVCN